MKDGLYYTDYYGPFGKGHGHFIVRGGNLYGTDVADGQYIGKVTLNESTGEYEVSVDFAVPIGAYLVIDGRMRNSSDVIHLDLSFSPPELGKPKAFDTHLGSLTVTLTRVGDVPIQTAAE